MPWCSVSFLFVIYFNIHSVYTRLILGSRVWIGINCMKWRQHLNLKSTGNWIPKTSWSLMRYKIWTHHAIPIIIPFYIFSYSRTAINCWNLELQISIFAYNHLKSVASILPAMNSIKIFSLYSFVNCLGRSTYSSKNWVWILTKGTHDWIGFVCIIFFIKISPYQMLYVKTY